MTESPRTNIRAIACLRVFFPPLVLVSPDSSFSVDGDRSCSIVDQDNDVERGGGSRPERRLGLGRSATTVAAAAAEEEPAFKGHLRRFLFLPSASGGGALEIICGERMSSNVMPR